MDERELNKWWNDLTEDVKEIMFLEYAYEKMKSKCECDYKNLHRWKSKGISLTGYDCALQEIFQYSQCKKVIRIDLVEINE